MSDEKFHVEQLKVPMVEVPARQIPGLRYSLAIKAGVKQIMMTTWGGLGDQVCAEPTLRYAAKLFDGYDICLMTSYPQLFTHIKFKKVFTKGDLAVLSDDDWLVLHTYMPPHNMGGEFVVHHYTQAVDAASLYAFQRQLPVQDREISLPGAPLTFRQPDIVIHPGRHWPSNTFPKHWWSEVIARIASSGVTVGIVGKDVSEDIGTVDVDLPKNCLDLRNRLSLEELVSVLQMTRVVLTNDSAPLHIAASGWAKILFLAGAKHPDYITHWRNGVFGARMENLTTGGLWDSQESSPARETPLSVDAMDPSEYDRILPTPAHVAGRALDSLR